jgi:ribosomal protein S18 acetylase RimI-like enzyme
MERARPSRIAAAAEPEIRLLRPDDVASLRLGRHRRANEDTLRQLLADSPDRSVWTPDTLEFALVTPWRHRREIAVIDELAAVRHARVLLQAAVHNSQRAGDAMTLIMEMDEQRQPAFYERAGLFPLESIITYDLPRVRAVSVPTTLTFTPADPTNPADLAALLDIDHRAFPWLWWNSDEEFRVYGDSPGTELYLGISDGQPVSYFGISRFPGWGHLDRIAVDPGAQGRGIGRVTLAQAINVLHRAGARRIALSTQQENRRSQHLYEGFGFQRSPGYDYRLYGTPIPDNGATTGPDDMRRAGNSGGAPEDDNKQWAAASAKFSS